MIEETKNPNYPSCGRMLESDDTIWEKKKRYDDFSKLGKPIPKELEGFEQKLPIPAKHLYLCLNKECPRKFQANQYVMGIDKLLIEHEQKIKEYDEKFKELENEIENLSKALGRIKHMKLGMDD